MMARFHSQTLAQVVTDSNLIRHGQIVIHFLTFRPEIQHSARLLKLMIIGGGARVWVHGRLVVLQCANYNRPRVIWSKNSKSNEAMK